MSWLYECKVSENKQKQTKSNGHEMYPHVQELVIFFFSSISPWHVFEVDLHDHKHVSAVKNEMCQAWDEHLVSILPNFLTAVRKHTCTSVFFYGCRPLADARYCFLLYVHAVSTAGQALSLSGMTRSGNTSVKMSHVLRLSTGILSATDLWTW